MLSTWLRQSGQVFCFHPSRAYLLAKLGDQASVRYPEGLEGEDDAQANQFRFEVVFECRNGRMAPPPFGRFGKRDPKIKQIVDLRVEVFVNFAHGSNFFLRDSPTARNDSENQNSREQKSESRKRAGATETNVVVDDVGSAAVTIRRTDVEVEVVPRAAPQHANIG